MKAQPTHFLRVQYEELRKAHIRKLQAELSKGPTGSASKVDYNQFPIEEGTGATKEQRLGIQQ